jgi:hypothetical protein
VVSTVAIPQGLHRLMTRLTAVLPEWLCVGCVWLVCMQKEQKKMGEGFVWLRSLCV